MQLILRAPDRCAVRRSLGRDDLGPYSQLVDFWLAATCTAFPGTRRPKSVVSHRQQALRNGLLLPFAELKTLDACRVRSSPQ